MRPYNAVIKENMADQYFVAVDETVVAEWRTSSITRCVSATSSVKEPVIVVLTLKV